MRGVTERGLARLLDCSPATAHRRLDYVIEELTAVLNRGGAVAETNGVPGPYDVALVSLLTARWCDKTSATKAPPTYREDIEAALSQLDGGPKSCSGCGWKA